jgi:hypothetical protein
VRLVRNDAEDWDDNDTCVVAGPAMVPLILAVLAGHRLGGYH